MVLSTNIKNVSLGHYKLHAGLQVFMKIIGTSGHFSFSEELEKKIKEMKLHLHEDDDRAYTDFKAIHIGLGFSYFDGTLDENYVTCKVIVGHEVGHIRITSKKIWNHFCQTSTGKYKSLGNFSTDILNITEDGRIEYHMGKISKFLLDGFFVLRQKMGVNIQKGFDEISNPEDMKPFEKLHHIRNAIIYMVCTLRLPFINNSDVMSYLEEIYPYVIYSRTTNSTQGAVDATHKIMEIISPLRDEMEESGEERKIKSEYDSSSKGSGEPTENEALDEMGSKDELDKHIPEELKELLEKLNEKVKEEFDNAEKNSDDEMIEKETDSSSKTKKELVEEIASRSKEMKEKLDEVIKEKVKEVQKTLVEDSSAEEVLNDHLKKSETSNEQKAKELKEREKMEELNPPLDEALHSECKADFKSKDEMQTFLPHEYDAALQPFHALIKKSAKELEKISEESIQLNLRNKRQGRLDKKALIRAGAFNDPKVFVKKKIDINNLSMDVMLLVDVSGSNGVYVGDTMRYELNRIIAMTLHEILKKAKFNHSVWSFEENERNNELFAPMVDFSNCFNKNAGLHLKDIDAYANNRDGFAISYAGEYLRQHSNSGKKLLLVLSDGLPYAHQYCGPSANADVRNVIDELEEKGVKTIGIFSGEESDNKVFGDMYKNAIFANHESLKEMPKKLKELLIKEFKEHVKKF